MKKQLFYKTMRNQKDKGYHLEEAQGYKKEYTDETGATIYIYFDNIDGFWGATEQETGAALLNGFYSTLKEAQNEINGKIKTIFEILNSESIKQARKIKFDLLCKL